MNKFPVIYSTLFFSVAKWPSSELQNCTNAIATKMSSSPRLSGICLPFGHCPGPDPDLDSELESGMGLGERAVGWWVSHPLSVVSVAQHKFSLSLGPSVLQAKGETLLAGATSFAYGNSRTTHCPPFNSLAPPSPALPPPGPWPHGPFGDCQPDRNSKWRAGAREQLLSDDDVDDGSQYAESWTLLAFQRWILIFCMCGKVAGRCSRLFATGLSQSVGCYPFSAATPHHSPPLPFAPLLAPFLFHFFYHVTLILSGNDHEYICRYAIEPGPAVFSPLCIGTKLSRGMHGKLSEAATVLPFKSV